MDLCETERLRLRHLELSDAAFILKLVNEPSFIANIRDSGVRDLDGARAYIANGPLKSYATHGFGLYLVELKDQREPIGMCGLVKRDGLDSPDIGYALLPAFWGQGYAVEAGAAVLAYARETLGIQRVVGITALHNEASMGVLRKLGLRHTATVVLPGHSDASALFTPDAE